MKQNALNIVKIGVIIIGIMWAGLQFFFVRTINSFDNKISNIEIKIDEIIEEISNNATHIEVFNTKFSYLEKDIEKLYREIKK